ncbi:hypothetical protein BHE90_003110 [Fusarium euwallaceae]|uniref:Uncharacterized protein n=1 Tax=Fusarium euwallaceae TaxID=1147111 RepID=A0A430M3E4_9HYPO|nr:hypothetical protein BHE90_003110 [Fusarium euwallaceae]
MKPVWRSSSANQTYTVEILLDAGADDSTGGHSKDALHAAIEGGHADIVLLLLTRGFAHRPCDRLRGREQWPVRSSGPGDLLREASPERVAREDSEYDENENEDEDLEAVMPLTDLEAIFEADQHPWAHDNVAKPNEQERDSFKYINALDSAVRSGHESVVNLILNQEDALDLGDRPVEKAVAVAVEQGLSSVLELLLKHMATRIPITDYLKSLFEAARLSKTPESLGAEQVFAIASQYCTSIELDKFRAETFTMARRYEASDDLTPVSVAQDISCGYTRNGNMQRNIKPQPDPNQIVKMLLDLGANADELGGQQMYPIQAAAEFCPPSVAKQLIEAGVDVNLAVGEDSAIFKATGRELSSGEVLRMLVDAGVKLPNEETPIHRLFEKTLKYFDPDPQKDGRPSRRRGFQLDQTLEDVFEKGPRAAISTLMALYPNSMASDKRHEHVLQMAAFLNKHELVATLLSRGVHVNATGHYYGTALQAAARCGHNGQWETALRAAIVGGHEEVVRTLLHNGADLKLGSKFETSNHGDISSSCLQLAVRANRVGIVTAILEAGAVPSDDESNRMGEDVDQPPLIISAQRGNLEITKALIDSGAHVNSVGRKMGSSILYDEHASPLCAAIAKKRRKVAKLLLEHGADVKQTVEGCKSPLSLAVKVEDQSLVRLLLKHGANVDTVLTEAAEHNHLGIVQDLVATTARAGTDQTYWTNPIIAALKKPYGGEVKDIRIVEVLLDALMDTPDPGPVIEEALSKAIEEENSKGMSLILDYLSVSALRLCQACSAGAEEAVMRMLQHGVSPNEADNNDNYPIHLAAAHLQPAVVNVLIEHVVDLNAMNQHSKTPLQIALKACAAPRLDFSDSGPARSKAHSVAARKRRRLSKWPQDIRNNPPIIEFPKFHRCEEIAATLLDHGASPVSAESAAGGPPLHLACLIGSKQTIVKLLEKGANVNEIGGHFEHVLLIAIATNRPDLVAILL